MDFTNAQVESPVPRFTGSNYGLGVLGAMMPARASTTEEYNYETEMMEEVEGSSMCLTEVIPWPFAEDEEGIAFDQENLYGVRTRVWRRPLADGGGDKEWWTAVPKTLPGGYTAVTRCHIGYAKVLDYIGNDPMSGFTWNHRTPTGLLLNDTTDPDGYRAQWSPMNLNQQVLSASIGDAFTGQWVFYGPEPEFDIGDTLYVVALLASDHIGFRGGKLTFTISAGYTPTAVISGSHNYEIVAVPVDEYWDPFNADDESMVEVLESGTVSWSFSSFSDPPVVVEHTLGDMRPSNPGIRYNFFIRYPYDTGLSGDVPAPIYDTSHLLKLSPRTDVPLPWFASQRNRVAPGGIIVPP